jgi:hypothetical protein
VSEARRCRSHRIIIIGMVIMMIIGISTGMGW